MVQQKLSYTEYRSDDPTLPVSFLYPEDWQVREIRESDYAEVDMVGPRNRADTYSLAVILRASRAHDGRVEPADVDAAVSAYVSGLARLRNFRELFRARGHLDGRYAVEVEASYSMPLPLKAVHPRLTTIVERRIFLQDADRLYEIVYRADEEDFSAYLDAFEKVVRILQFRSHEGPDTHRPLVTQVSA
ncbi:MAG: hypothetical protein HY690_15320 [Chloroflexi bacterium]|nr:hypothetical protein [Chloroflexota bacterium]